MGLWSNILRASPTLHELYTLYKYTAWTNQRQVAVARSMTPPGKFTFLHDAIMRSDVPGDPEAIVKAMDAFSRNDWMMTLGDVKGRILQDTVRKLRPQVALEMGTYCGYSALCIAPLLPPDGCLVSLDVDARYLTVARDVLGKAGLLPRILLLREFAEELSLPPEFRPVDFVLLDHAKYLYLPTLKRIEPWLRPGSVVLANGTGASKEQLLDYLIHVRGSGLYDSVSHVAMGSARDGKDDAMERSVYLGPTAKATNR